jgi:hypothetical protein
LTKGECGHPIVDRTPVYVGRVNAEVRSQGAPCFRAFTQKHVVADGSAEKVQAAVGKMLM